MAQTLIRGSTQILDASITAAKLAGGIALSQITGGTSLIKADGTVAHTADQSFGNFKITNLADAVAAQDAVNLRTAQSLINGISIKRARVVATTNQALTGLSTIDGVTLTSGQVVLLTGQSTGSQNGPFAVAAGAWSRPSDWAAASSQKSTLWFIEEGTTNHDTKWIAITDAIVVDTTSVTITQDASGGTYTNGNGLSLTGNVFAVKLLSTGGISFDGSQNLQVALDGTNLSTSASGLKIANGTAGQVMVAGAAGVAAFTTISGDATLASTGVLTLAASVLKTTSDVTNEVPSGTINGVNATFVLANTPVVGKEKVYLNGVRLFPGAGNDYTIATATITMLIVPLTGDRLTVDYLK
jgi:hypothetical protein